MNTINTVRLENFQSHLDTSIDFSTGLNVIVGQSDSGKTSILRAIRWVLYNQPRGTDFMRVGADFVRVTVTFSNKTTIVRERTASKNRYVIKKEGEDDLVLEGFGTNVPEEVLQAHGMKPLRIDRDHELLLHVSQQLDGPFLLDQPASLRAKAIGRISGAHFLDMAIRDTTKDVAKLNQQARYEEEEIERLTEALVPYESLDEQKRQLQEIEKKLEIFKQMKKRQERLSMLADSLNENHRQRENVEIQRMLVLDVERWQEKHERLTLLTSRYQTYRQRKNQLDENAQLRKHHKEWIEKTEVFTIVKQREQELTEAYSRYKQLLRLQNQLTEVSRVASKATAVLRATGFADDRHVEKIEQLRGNAQRLRKLKELQVHRVSLMNQMEQTKQLHKKMKEAEKEGVSLTHLQDTISKWNMLKERFEQIKMIEQRLHDGRSFLEHKRKELVELEHQYEHQLLNEGTCPTCGGDVSKEKLQALLRR
ncbi:AAA family ATPase [Halalkalibacterium ligniniphilum]|uniref:AAA family ATPase n=2 Tax=Halalkalibacterium ligniniphilum TaxID=1134413 RepID=UPI00034D1C34|nr:AAA family ATPase [Halalkalibacterium ligniniphilum]